MCVQPAGRACSVNNLLFVRRGQGCRVHPSLAPRRSPAGKNKGKSRDRGACGAAAPCGAGAHFALQNTRFW